MEVKVRECFRFIAGAERTPGPLGSRVKGWFDGRTGNDRQNCGVSNRRLVGVQYLVFHRGRFKS